MRTGLLLNNIITVRVNIFITIIIDIINII